MAVGVQWRYAGSRSAALPGASTALPRGRSIDVQPAALAATCHIRRLCPAHMMGGMPDGGVVPPQGRPMHLINDGQGLGTS